MSDVEAKEEIKQETVIKTIDSKNVELESQKTSDLTSDQMAKIIEDLRNENAKRRIKNKKAEEEIAEVKKLYDNDKSKLTEVMSKLEQYELARKEEEMKDASELEKAKAKLDEYEKKQLEFKKQLESVQKESLLKEIKIKQQDREFMVERLVSELGGNFASDFERNGFLAELKQTDENGRLKTDDEEVILKVKEFVKIKKTIPITPEAGPTQRVAQTPLIEEVKALLSKPKHKQTNDDKARLNEILAMKEFGGI